jgi:hypothetical protein
MTTVFGWSAELPNLQGFYQQRVTDRDGAGERLCIGSMLAESEMNSKVITTSDDMLSTLTNLR